jgi:hypothetical protein
MRRVARCLLLTFSLLRRSQPREAALEYDPERAEAWRVMVENAQRVV